MSFSSGSEKKTHSSACPLPCISVPVLPSSEGVGSGLRESLELCRKNGTTHLSVVAAPRSQRLQFRVGLGSVQAAAFGVSRICPVGSNLSI